jgi:hypothetical protein
MLQVQVQVQVQKHRKRSLRIVVGHKWTIRKSPQVLLNHKVQGKKNKGKNSSQNSEFS